MLKQKGAEVQRARSERPFAESLMGRRSLSYSRMRNIQLLVFAQGLVDQRGVTDGSVLLLEDPFLFNQLKKRDLLGCLEYYTGKPYSQMDDGELIDIAKRVDGLRTNNYPLFKEIVERGLMNDAVTKRTNICWKSFGIDGLAEFGRMYIELHEISSPSELKGKFSKLHGALESYGIMDRVFP